MLGTELGLNLKIRKTHIFEFWVEKPCFKDTRYKFCSRCRPVFVEIRRAVHQVHLFLGVNCQHRKMFSSQKCPLPLFPPTCHKTENLFNVWTRQITCHLWHILKFPFGSICNFLVSTIRFFSFLCRKHDFQPCCVYFFVCACLSIFEFLISRCHFQIFFSCLGWGFG